MKVRDVQWGDLDDLVRNYYSYYEERDRDNPAIGLTLFSEKPSFGDEIAWFARLFSEARKGTRVASVAEVDGHAVGLSEVVRHTPQEETAHMGVLGIAIHRDHRGKGVGRALLQDVVEKSRGKFEVIRLSVFEDNERARRLYASLGFVVTGKIPKSVKRADRYYDELVMVLDLGGA